MNTLDISFSTTPVGLDYVHFLFGLCGLPPA
jgi:hypothetical protein